MEEIGEKREGKVLTNDDIMECLVVVLNTKIIKILKDKYRDNKWSGVKYRLSSDKTTNYLMGVYKKLFNKCNQTSKVNVIIKVEDTLLVCMEEILYKEGYYGNNTMKIMNSLINNRNSYVNCIESFYDRNNI